MAKQKGNINRLYRRFLRGEVNAREEAQLEQYARQDDFLAEAMSGLRQQPTAKHEEVLERMRAKLPRDEAKVRPFGFYRVAAAASVLLLIGASLFLLPNWLQQTEQSITMEKTASEPEAAPATFEAENMDNVRVEDETTTAPTTTPSPINRQDQEAPRTTSTPQASSRTVIENPKSIPPPTSPAPATEEVATLAPTVAAEEPLLEEETEADIANTTFEDVAITPPANNAAGQFEPNDKKRDASRSVKDFMEGRRSRAIKEEVLPAGFQLITGFVTDENDLPVADANVRLPGQPLGEPTDTNGYFQLLADVSVSQLEIAHPAYQNAAITLPRGEKDLQIGLESIREPSEDEFKFNGAISTYYPNVVPSAAAPVDITTKQLKRDILDDKPAEFGTGKVRISFSVQEDGSLTDFSTSGKSSSKLQRYVRRYLQQKSEWKLFRGDEPARVYMVLNFKE